MRNAIHTGLITLAVIMVGAAYAAPAASTRLANGLTVIAVPAEHGRIAGIAVVIGSSITDEPDRMRGARALLQQLMVLDSHKQMAERLAPISAFVNPQSSGLGVNTDWEFVEASLAVHVEELQEGLETLARHIFEVEITQERLDEARELVKRGYDLSHESPVQETYDLFRRAFYGDHPLGASLQGDPETLDAITLQDLQAFHDAQYVPSNAVVCVVAPLSVEQIQEAVGAAFGGIKAAPPPQPPELPSLPTDSRVEVGDAPGLSQASMVVGVPLPPIEDEQFVAGEMIAALLEGRGGRLRRDLSLLQTLGLAIPTRLLEAHYPIGTLPIAMSHAPFLAVHALCSPNTIEATRRGLLRHLLALRTGGVTDAELERARQRVINKHMLEQRRPVDAALYRARRALFGLGDVQEVKAAVEAVTGEDLTAVAQQYFGRHAIGVQMPAS